MVLFLVSGVISSTHPMVAGAGLVVYLVLFLVLGVIFFVLVLDLFVLRLSTPEPSFSCRVLFLALAWA